jgi:hypothetical protein
MKPTALGILRSDVSFDCHTPTAAGPLAPSDPAPTPSYEITKLCPKTVDSPGRTQEPMAGATLTRYDVLS